MNESHSPAAPRRHYEETRLFRGLLYSGRGEPGPLKDRRADGHLPPPPRPTRLCARARAPAGPARPPPGLTEILARLHFGDSGATALAGTTVPLTTWLEPCGLVPGCSSLSRTASPKSPPSVPSFPFLLLLLSVNLFQILAMLFQPESYLPASLPVCPTPFCKGRLTNAGL